MHFICLVTSVNSTKGWNEKGINSEHQRKNNTTIHSLKISQTIALKIWTKLT